MRVISYQAVPHLQPGPPWYMQRVARRNAVGGDQLAENYFRRSRAVTRLWYWGTVNSSEFGEQGGWNGEMGEGPYIDPALDGYLCSR